MDTDIKTSELGHTFSYRELQSQFKAVWGGVAWPGKNPGFAVVVGMDKEKHFDSRDIYLLDEYESNNMRKLVRQCGAFDRKYYISLNDFRLCRGRDLPGRWIGASKNDAASRCIEDMNYEFNRENPDVDIVHRWRFSLDSTLLYKMENLYPYILTTIKELLEEERRQLFLKDSKVVNYLSEIEESDIADLEVGSYPAVEALGIVVAEMRDADVFEQQSKKYRLRNSGPYRNRFRFRRR